MVKSRKFKGKLFTPVNFSIKEARILKKEGAIKEFRTVGFGKRTEGFPIRKNKKKIDLKIIFVR